MFPWECSELQDPPSSSWVQLSRHQRCETHDWKSDLFKVIIIFWKWTVKAIMRQLPWTWSGALSLTKYTYAFFSAFIKHVRVRIWYLLQKIIAHAGWLFFRVPSKNILCASETMEESLSLNSRSGLFLLLKKKFISIAHIVFLFGSRAYLLKFLKNFH